MTRPAWLSWMLAEPRLTDYRPRNWWDYCLVVCLWLTTLLEALLRDDMPARWPTAVVVALLATTLLWRRSQPLVALLMTIGAVITLDLAMKLTGRPPVEFYSMAFILLLMYSLARWDSGNNVVIGLVAAVTLWAFSGIANYSNIGDQIGGLIVLLVPFEAGGLVRYQRSARTQAVDRAKMEERAELARELHDTVAHRVSAIAIQAQVGQMLAARTVGDNSDLNKTLAAIEEEASRTLNEMRSMVGSLRDPDTGVQLLPQQGVLDIPRLGAVGMWPGIEVSVAIPAGLDVDAVTGAALYRIAQESVTNAARHAKDATLVTITVHDRADRVELVVADDGTPSPASGSDALGFGLGFGLLGMAERAEQLGGDFAAEPTSTGWQVTASLPCISTQTAGPVTEVAAT